MKRRSIIHISLICLSIALPFQRGRADAAHPANETSPLGFCYHLVYSRAGDDRIGGCLDSIAESGARWIRCDISWPWQRRDPETHRYQFANVDRAVDLMSRKGLSFLPIINMARKDSLPLHENLDAWCAFIRQTAERYRDKVTYWEIWNEQNFVRPKIWGAKDLPTHAARYTACLKAAARTIKAVSPQARILYGGTSHVPLDFIEQTLREGAGDAFDVMNVHPYNTGGLPEYIPGQLRQLKLLMARYGVAARPTT